MVAVTTAGGGDFAKSVLFSARFGLESKSLSHSKSSDSLSEGNNIGLTASSAMFPSANFFRFSLGTGCIPAKQVTRVAEKIENYTQYFLKFLAKSP